MFRHRLTGLVLACSTAAVTGCGVVPHSGGRSAVDQGPAPSALERISSCCQTLADLDYQPLTGDDQNLELDFSEQTPVFSFPDGKSFYRAFKLPQSASRLTLSVHAPIHESGVFVPTLLLLNDRYQPVRHIQDDFLTYDGPNGFHDARLAGEVSVAPGPDAAYLVVYTRSSQRQDNTHYDTVEQTYRRLRGFQQIDSSIHKARHTATGQLSVSIQKATGEGGLLTSLLGHDEPSQHHGSVGKSKRLKNIVNDAGQRPTEAGTGPASRTAASNQDATNDQATVNAQNRPTTPVSAPGVRPADATSSQSIPPQEGFDYRRMINAALKAGDIELAIQLADRAEASGHHGIRSWLSQRLEVR